MSAVALPLFKIQDVCGQGIGGQRYERLAYAVTEVGKKVARVSIVIRTSIPGATNLQEGLQTALEKEAEGNKFFVCINGDSIEISSALTQEELSQYVDLDEGHFLAVDHLVCSVKDLVSTDDADRAELIGGVIQAVMQHFPCLECIEREATQQKK